jgi:GxxExxY protein
MTGNMWKVINLSYYADIILENKIILELKATKSIAEEHEFQLLNNLKATETEIWIIIELWQKT